MHKAVTYTLQKLWGLSPGGGGGGGAAVVRCVDLSVKILNQSISTVTAPVLKKHIGAGEGGRG